MQIIYIGIGGFIGAVARFLVTKFCNNYFPNFPVGTLIVNLSGSFLLGLIAYAFLMGKIISPEFRHFMTIGFLGAYTTMSSFAYESFRLMELSDYFFFGLNLILNIVLCILAIYAGRELAAKLF